MINLPLGASSFNFLDEFTPMLNTLVIHEHFYHANQIKSFHSRLIVISSCIHITPSLPYCPLVHKMSSTGNFSRVSVDINFDTLVLLFRLRQSWRLVNSSPLLPMMWGDSHLVFAGLQIHHLSTSWNVSKKVARYNNTLEMSLAISGSNSFLMETVFKGTGHLPRISEYSCT